MLVARHSIVIENTGGNEYCLESKADRGVGLGEMPGMY